MTARTFHPMPGHDYLTYEPRFENPPRIAVIRCFGSDRIIGEVAESRVVEDTWNFTPARYFRDDWGVVFGREPSGDLDYLRAALTKRMADIISTQFDGIRCARVRIKDYPKRARRRVI